MKSAKRTRRNVEYGRATQGWKGIITAIVVAALFYFVVAKIIVLIKSQTTIKLPTVEPERNLLSATDYEEANTSEPIEEPVTYRETLMYTVSLVDLKQDPSETSEPILTIPESTKVSVQILGNPTPEGWALVSVGENTGYVETEYLAVYNESIHLDDLRLEYQYQDLVIKLIEVFDFDVDQYFFYGMMYTENRFKSEPESWAGAQGILQVMPSTWRTMYDKLQKEYPEIAATIVDDPLDKASNITIGLFYVKYLRDYYGYSSVREHASQILTSYNRGPGGAAYYYRKYDTYSSGYSREILRAADYIRENGTWKEGL